MINDIEMQDSFLMNEVDQPEEDVTDTEDLEIVTLMSMLRNGDHFSLITTMEIDSNENAQNVAGPAVATSASNRVLFPSNTRNVLQEYQAKKATLLKGNKRGKCYRRYTDSQLSKFIDLICEQKSVKFAAVKSGIELKSAYRYRKTWNETFIIPDPKRRGPKKSNILGEAHLLELIPLIDLNSTITLKEMLAALVKKFPDLEVSQSSFYRFATEMCSLSIKKLEPVTEYRTLPTTIEKRKAVVESWLEDPEMDFEKNCVFVDESGFNFHMNRSRGWSKSGNPSKTSVPKVRGNNISLIGAICNKGLVNVSLRKPSTMVSRKRRADGTMVNVSERVGTRTEHFLNYLKTLLNVLDASNLKGYYILMDNASIHTSNEVKELITSRGYRYKYFPPYSPFLNAIEEAWAKIKAGIIRKPFDDCDSLTPRLIESCKLVTQQDCQGWIRHAISFFPRCLQKEML
jgi:transposase